MNEQLPNEIPEERRFLWRNIEAYLAGELPAADRARIDAFLRECPHSRDYVEGEKQLVEAMRRCVNEAAPCPEGLRQRVLDALDDCEVVESNVRASFPWLGAGMMTAACALLVVALVILLGQREPAESEIYDNLQPLVSHVSLDAPVSPKCKRRQAEVEYRKYFAEGPALPGSMDGNRIKLSEFECPEVEGKRVMCAVYDAPDGDRFGVLVFPCTCLFGRIPDEMQAMEVQIDDMIVLLWREGELYRALVGRDAASLRRHMNELRGSL